MKIDDLARPGLMALALAGLAGTALLGFAAGVAVARDPEALRRNARRVAREAARGLEQASLLAAQAREHFGDMWAEAREEALAEVEARDFARAAAAAAATEAASAKPARKRASRPRKAAAAKTAAAATTAPQAQASEG
jgi:hypothetical protein